MTAPREESPRRRTDRPARPAARAPGREQAPAGGRPWGRVLGPDIRARAAGRPQAHS